MVETNEEIIQKLKQSICDYYMGFVRQKLKTSHINGKENEINNQIMQFLEAQIDTSNSTICKDDIVNILVSVVSDDNTFDMDLHRTKISNCFPDISTITIENGEATYVTEKQNTLFNGIEENSYYLYVSPDYYNKNIESIETEIKKLEKGFSKHDLKGFEEKYEKDLSLKQYELESAKVYESASNQIELKKQKFNNISTKMINEYGIKYNEIIDKDLDETEKQQNIYKLFEETKFYDEKNRQAISRLNSEYEQLSQNFTGKVQSSKTIYSQMQNLHLFDKNRYFEDMMSNIVPELRDLYKKRYLLNSYRKSHNEIVYTGKSGFFSNLFENFSKGLKKNNSPLMLGPHFERDLPTKESVNLDNVDKNLVNALVDFYGNSTSNTSEEFTSSLSGYFKEHYNELMANNLNTDDLSKIANQFNVNPDCFDNNLIIKDELIYENGANGLNVIYATDKAINGVISDLYSETLYYNHLAKENLSKANLTANLQSNFIRFANQNEIEVTSNFKTSTKKRFVKRKSKSNIIDFNQEKQTNSF